MDIIFISCTLFLIMLLVIPEVAINTKNKQNKINDEFYVNREEYIKYLKTLPDEFYKFFIELAFVVFANDSYIDDYSSMCKRYKYQPYTQNMYSIMFIDDWYRNTFKSTFDKIIKFHNNMPDIVKINYNKDIYYRSKYKYYKDILCWFVAYVKFNCGDFVKFPQIDSNMSYADRYILLKSTPLDSYKPYYKQYLVMFKYFRNLGVY